MGVTVASRSSSSWIVRAFPGIALTCVVSAVSVLGGAAEEALFGRAIIEPLVLAILVGMAVRTATGDIPWAEVGIRFGAKEVLEFAVLLLGATMDVPRLLASGPRLAVGIVLLVGIALVCGVAVGRAVGLSHRLAILVACGNAICGNSAIAAVAPVIGAEREDVAASIALTAVLGVAVVIALPLAIPLLGYSNYQYGVFAGLTVYAVPQVLAASFSVSVLSGQVATAVKLARVLMLGPVVVFFAVRSHAATNPGTKIKVSRLVPWFVLGFIVLAALRSTGFVPDAAANESKRAATWLTIGAMAALGLTVDVRSVRQVGTRVAIAVAGSLTALMILAVALIHIIAVH